MNTVKVSEKTHIEPKPGDFFQSRKGEIYILGHASDGFVTISLQYGSLWAAGDTTTIATEGLNKLSDSAEITIKPIQ